MEPPGMKYRHDRPDSMPYRDPYPPRPDGYDRYGRNDRGPVDYYPQPRMYGDERMPDGGPYRAGVRPPPHDGRVRSPSPYMMHRRTPPPYGFYDHRPYPPSPPPPYGPPPSGYRDGPPGPPPIERRYYDRPRSPPPPLPRRSRSPLPPTNRRRSSPQVEHNLAPEADPTATRTLFVGNVDYELTADDLKRTFEPYGVVEEVKLKQSPQGQSNPYAFVRFFNLNQAYIAKIEMAGKLIGRFRCRIGYGRAIPTNCVWIGGLGAWLTKEDLEKEFGRFGRMTRVVWPGRADYAYIVYDSVESARRAVDDMRGFVFRGSSVRLRTDFTDVAQIDKSSSDGVRKRSSERRVSIRRSRSFSSPPRRKRSNSSVNRPKREHNNRVHHHDRGNGVGRDVSRGNGGGRGVSRSRSSSSQSFKKSRHSSNTRKRRKSLSSTRGHSPLASDRSISPERPPASKKDRSFQIGNINEAGTVLDLARCLPVVWSGNLMLKNQSFSTRLHRVSGQPRLIEMLLDRASGGDDKTLKITQRLRMDDAKLEEVRRRIALSGPDGWNILLAVPGSVDDRRKAGVEKSDCLADLVAYLREKKAAGVLALPPDCKQGCESGLLHIFPSCKFVHRYLLEHSPKLMMDYTTEDYMIVFLVSITV